MKPEDLAKDTEHSQQTAFFCWLSQQSDPRFRFVFAIPNGGQRSVVTASRLRAEGVKAGVPDVFVPIPSGVCAGLWIEFKRPGTMGQREGLLSDDQKRWADYLISQKYAYVTAYDYRQAVDYLVKYLHSGNAS